MESTVDVLLNCRRMSATTMSESPKSLLLCVVVEVWRKEVVHHLNVNKSRKE